MPPFQLLQDHVSGSRIEVLIDCILSITYDRAAPYSLNCGHTFCGTCLLKWLFAAFDQVFHHWMEPLSCPLCHAVLPSIPRSTPREICTFPFVLNRSTEEVINSYIAVLKNTADNHGHDQGTEEVSHSVEEWAEGKPARIDWEGRE
ncbi:hypothetical protein L227DRAFT_514563 [Lentinus tigrinus ALCF2SS1-6]|uniref:RING-type domain-containing protein n=1 Tax=Lentinus tigrinus ALCF2SS1-6 TaxID=1328759 RepID=A0A5C2RNB1_9APHY|nr:hypothetical protein L227DRAFT_514563 [Lentinus tigrinus ALCF2SS1-6]